MAPYPCNQEIRESNLTSACKRIPSPMLTMLMLWGWYPLNTKKCCDHAAISKPCYHPWTLFVYPISSCRIFWDGLASLALYSRCDDSTTPLRPAAEVRMQLPDIVLLRENWLGWSLSRQGQNKNDKMGTMKQQTKVCLEIGKHVSSPMRSLAALTGKEYTSSG